MRRLIFALLPFLAVLSGCKPAESARDAGTDGALPPALSFTGAETTLLFTFVDDRGSIRSVDKLDEVPESRRENLMVVDLSKTPEQRQADRYVYFANAKTKGPDGLFQAFAVSRYEAPPLAGSVPPEAFLGDGGILSTEVVVYSASWCGFCKKTKSFLKTKGVPFVEKDVEKMPGADRELQAKAKRAGIRVSGVPVTDFMGELVVGFDQQRLEQLIARRK